VEIFHVFVPCFSKNMDCPGFRYPKLWTDFHVHGQCFHVLVFPFFYKKIFLIKKCPPLLGMNKKNVENDERKKRGIFI
jgi:hypothetical protein